MKTVQNSAINQITRNRGVCMVNRIIMLGAPGAIVEGNTVVIGADTYEFRASTPPIGGTAGRIWVYQGLNSAASRANFLDAVNGVVNAATVSRTGVGTAGTNVELMRAVAGVTLGDVIVYSADAIGGNPAPSATATATTETLATATDIWDQATMYGGVVAGQDNFGSATVTVLADMITKGHLQVFFPFAPVHAIVLDRMRPHDEVVTITGNYVQVILTGGVSPNIQPNDVIDVIAVG